MNWDPIISVLLMLIATIGLFISVKVKEWVERQKAMALLALLAPVCKDPNIWALFIRYLAQQNRLLVCDPADEEYLIKLLERLGIKIDINKKLLVEAIPID